MENNEIVKDVIDKVAAGLESLAQRLGVAATEIWRFSVAAKTVEARRDIAKGCCLLILPLILSGWGIHVLTMRLPHQIDHRTDWSLSDCRSQQGFNFCHSIPKEVEDDRGLTNDAYVLIASGVICGIIALILFGVCAETIIDGIADAKMIEYNAYQDILGDWRD